MADIRNKNELKHRIDVFLHEFTSDEYKINEEYCKETMRMMADFIGLVNQRIDQKDKQINNLKKALKQYRDAEKQGLLLRLPCKIGGTVWESDEHLPICLTECIVERFEFDSNDDVYCIYSAKDGTFTAKRYLSEFGKTVFLTKEEAEQALEEMKGV